MAKCEKCGTQMLAVEVYDCIAYGEITENDADYEIWVKAGRPTFIEHFCPNPKCGAAEELVPEKRPS